MREWHKIVSEYLERMDFSPEEHEAVVAELAGHLQDKYEALLAGGATITHHHAVGRDHDRWYRRQQPELFGRALAAAKSALDPVGILNPGVIA